jgi:hypothetical protein
MEECRVVIFGEDDLEVEEIEQQNVPKPQPRNENKKREAKLPSHLKKIKKFNQMTKEIQHNKNVRWTEEMAIESELKIVEDTFGF